jgi:hypothetical protein
LLVLEEALPWLISCASAIHPGGSSRRRGILADRAGPMLLLVVLFARGGIDGLLAGRAVADALLQIEGLTKRFGGVSPPTHCAAVPRASLHAIIGPNGAGKTTLIGS